jgi:hypothetical protein
MIDDDSKSTRAHQAHIHIIRNPCSFAWFPFAPPHHHALTVRVRVFVLTVHVRYVYPVTEKPGAPSFNRGHKYNPGGDHARLPCVDEFFSRHNGK